MTEEASAAQMSDRGNWGRGLEFLMSCISMSVGLGNVWRFPNAAFENGGGAFLLPYLILLVIIGRPLYYLELILGQFSGLGPIKVWKCVPGIKGLGFAQVISVSYVTIFYNYIIALALHFMFSSMQSTLPWTECHDSWFRDGTNCSYHLGNDTESTSYDLLLSYSEDSVLNVTTLKRVSKTELYWKYGLLNLSEGLWEMTWINYQIVLCLLLAWVLVYLVVMNGVASLGKVSYFTALFPYTVLFALLGVACSRPGAGEGIRRLFTPEWDKLADITVWYKACEQSFFSLAVGYGNLVMYASYNNFRNNVYRDTLILSVLDTLTSILAGCVVFSVMGNLSHVLKVPFKEVIGTGGTDLAFIAYPEALARIPFVPQLWSVLFFFMLFVLGIGSSVAQMETVLTAIKDHFPSLHRKKWLVALCACVFFFCCGLPLATNAGIYVRSLLDNYGVATAAFLYATLEVTAIMWIYGLRNFCQDVRFMLRRKVGIFWKVTWFLITPISLIVIFIYGNYQLAIVPERTPGVPKWGDAIGWVLAVIGLIQIPLWMIIVVSKSHGHGVSQKLRNAFKPSPDWGPRDPNLRKEWIMFRNRPSALLGKLDCSTPVYTVKIQDLTGNLDAPNDTNLSTKTADDKNFRNSNGSLGRYSNGTRFSKVNGTYINKAPGFYDNQAFEEDNITTKL